ncbi:MAG: hypothetical protein AAF514_19040, partial [Verrucomicrobiota bacterium]
MANGELYQWLEAIRNRREYAEDQLSGGTPVFAVSRPEGILLFGLGLGQSKVFEVYDRHGMAALGNPVDIEKLRQKAIEAAHLEGFNRSPEDVTLRRLVGYALSPVLKDQFEQILSPPLLVRSLFAELGSNPKEDSLVTVDFDGVFEFASDGLAIATDSRELETTLRPWILSRLKPKSSLQRTINTLHTAWTAAIENQPLSSTTKVLSPPAEPPDNRTFE